LHDVLLPSIACNRGANRSGFDNTSPDARPFRGSGVIIPIRIKENSFDPDFVTVKVGTTVIWTNEDPGTHTVTYTGNDVMRFDSGPLVTKQSFPNTFLTAGRYTYTCKQHSFMTGTVLVE
jgi:plastocyanin